jgi:hypothetical protein
MERKRRQILRGTDSVHKEITRAFAFRQEKNRIYQRTWKDPSFKGHDVHGREPTE